MPKGYYLNGGELVEDDEESWIDWNAILDDESKTSQKIEKVFKKRK
ncbi:MAG: hypothetical protein WCN88_04730 [Candidatus Falkowbacteria bacterium]